MFNIIMVILNLYTAFASDDIIKAIHKLQPSLSYSSTHKLAKALKEVTASNECEISWPVLLAVAFNESSLLKLKVNKASGDYGLMQINYKNVKSMRLNKTKLMTDEKYSLAIACRILTENKTRLSFKYPHWVGAYRAGLAFWKLRINDNAKRYDKIIRRLVNGMGYRINSEYETVAN